MDNIAKNLINKIATRNVDGSNIKSDGGDIASLWSRARCPIRKLSSAIDIKWVVVESNKKISS